MTTTRTTLQTPSPTTFQTPPARPRPTSSLTSSRPRDDLPQVTSSLVPLPSGGRGHWSRQTTTHQHPLHLVPGTRSNRPTTNTPQHLLTDTPASPTTSTLRSAS